MAVLAGLDSPTINEFTKHPDHQQIATFFLGAVFITSLNYSSIWLRGFLWRCGKWITGRRSAMADVEDACSEKTPSIMGSAITSRTGESRTLVFTLSVCFAFASIAFFGSLVSFNPDTGGVACAFVVAWGGMASQTAHVVGLIILLFDMRELGIARLEFYIITGGLLAGMGLVFANNAIGTGAITKFEYSIDTTILSVKQPLSSAFCYRRHFLPTALASSLVYFVLEAYILLRLVFLIASQASNLRHRLASLKDPRTWRALSLLFLELLTIGPSLKHINILADFIPFSIGALTVLFTFNYKDIGREDSMTHSTITENVSRLSTVATTRTGWFSMISYGSSGQRNGSNIPPSPPPPIIPHPFSARSLNNPAIQEYGWQRRNRRSQARVSNTDTMSTQEGIIQVVESRRTPVRARTVVVTPTNIQSISQTSPSWNATNSITNPVPRTSSAPARSGILVHSWHGKARPDSMAIIPNRLSLSGPTQSKPQGTSESSDLGSVRISHIYEGYMLPIPPVPSSAGIRRYSSATLTSPMSSQEGGGDSNRRPVRLLTFESTFRANRDGYSGDNTRTSMLKMY